MRGFLVGTIGVVCGGIVVVVLKIWEVPHFAASMIGGGISVAGFIIQMWSALSMHFRFQRESRRKQEAHDYLMRLARAFASI